MSTAVQMSASDIDAKQLKRQVLLQLAQSVYLQLEQLAVNRGSGEVYSDYRRGDIITELHNYLATSGIVVTRVKVDSALRYLAWRQVITFTRQTVGLGYPAYFSITVLPKS